MEAEGEIFDMQLKQTPYKMLREKLVCLEDAKKRLNEIERGVTDVLFNVNCTV